MNNTNDAVDKSKRPAEAVFCRKLRTKDVREDFKMGLGKGSVIEVNFLDLGKK